MKRAFVDTLAGQIHYRTEGKGEPLLLLHQVPSSSSEFSDVIPILGQEFRVLAMDLPLFGDSYKTTGEPEIEDMAQAVIDFLHALGIEKTHIAGHHTGACVAVELSVGHPERVQKPILSACPSWTSEEGLKWLNSSLYREPRSDTRRLVYAIHLGFCHAANPSRPHGQGLRLRLGLHEDR